MTAHRTATVTRSTSESSVELTIDLDGSGRSTIDTSAPFFDHMLTALGKHALIDLTVRTTGDVDVDAHHSVEDTAIVLGQALRQALGDKRGIRRFGDALVPLDDPAAAEADATGRSKPWMPPAVVPTGPGAAEADAFTPCSGRLGVGWPGSVVLAAMAAAATASQEPGPVAGALIEL